MSRGDAPPQAWSSSPAASPARPRRLGSFTEDEDEGGGEEEGAVAAPSQLVWAPLECLLAPQEQRGIGRLPRRQTLAPGCSSPPTPFHPSHPQSYHRVHPAWEATLYVSCTQRGKHL